MNSNLVLKKIAYRYPNKKKELLKNISLEIVKGEFISIIGNSGSGKSTIAKIVGGYIIPSRGKAYINSENNIIIQPKSNVITVFQDSKFAIFPWLNIRENIELGTYKRNNESSIILEDLIKTLFADYESDPPLRILDKFPNELSGGQIQRAQIARAIYSNSDYVIFDEADSSLDIKNKERIKDVLLELRNKHTFGLLFITHDIDYAISLSDKIYLLKNGTLTNVDFPRDSNGILIDDCDSTIKENIIHALYTDN
jgi:ABC-type nitrate/sulfonate/bicarbonate transport system ATPase subunit